LITVAGTVIADFFARTLLDEPPRGSLLVIDEIGFHLGGAAPNTGAVLARLNTPVSLVGRIGNDPLGILVRQQIEKWADRVSLANDPDRPTTAVVGHVFADGNRSFIYAPGASAGFHALDLNLEEEKAHGSKALHLGYAYLLPQLDGLPMLRVFQRAQKLGLLTSLDVTHHSGPDWRKLRELLPFVDVFCPNSQEAEAITGESEPEAAAEVLLKNGVRQFVAIKNGELGAYARPANGRAIHYPRHHVEIVDSTGAGDAYIGGILAAWHRGLDWHEAARIANAVGALAVTKQGATEGLESWEQVMDLLNQENQDRAL
jgi:sugar/nucleoside kinase (ribokinase family)